MLLEKASIIHAKQSLLPHGRIEGWQQPEGLILKYENPNGTFLQLAIEDEIWPQYEQASIFFLFYWPHLGVNEDLP